MVPALSDWEEKAEEDLSDIFKDNALPPTIQNFFFLQISLNYLVLSQALKVH